MTGPVTGPISDDCGPHCGTMPVGGDENGQSGTRTAHCESCHRRGLDCALEQEQRVR